MPCLGQQDLHALDVEARARVKITFLRMLAGDDVVRQARAFDLSNIQVNGPCKAVPRVIYRCRDGSAFGTDRSRSNNDR